jgi:DNA invertase Pin-like site-specific DNA recombinase
VPTPKKGGPVSDERRELVRRLLRERMSLRGIARATGLSRSWLQTFVNALYREDTPHDPGPLKKSRAS